MGLSFNIGNVKRVKVPRTVPDTQEVLEGLLLLPLGVMMNTLSPGWNVGVE